MVKILTSWPVTLALCLMILIGTMVVKFWPRTVPFDQCSEEYKKYADMDGIEAAFVKDFKINDTLALDVTVLKALDSNSFKMLISDFNVPEPTTRQKLKIKNGKDIIFTKFILNSDSTQTADSDNKIKEMVAISYITNTFTIFYLNKDSESIAILEYNYPFPKK